MTVTRYAICCGVLQPYAPGAICKVCREWLKP